MLILKNSYSRDSFFQFSLLILLFCGLITVSKLQSEEETIIKGEI